MGTKANPGKFDCYAKCGEHEPHFTLRAKDATAPLLVDLWTHIQIGDIYAAVGTLHELCQMCLNIQAEGHGLSYDSEKANEAFDCAEAMRQWRMENPPC